MNATAAALKRTFNVGRRTVTITVQMPSQGSVSNMVVEWSPDVPTRFSHSELCQYRKGRDKTLAELGRRIDGNVAVAVI